MIQVYVLVWDKKERTSFLLVENYVDQPVLLIDIFFNAAESFRVLTVQEACIVSR